MASNPLLSVPGLGGFLAAQQQQEASEMGELQRAQTLAALLEKAKAQRQAQEYQAAVAGLGPNATQDQLAQVAARHAGPQAVLQSADRQAAITARTEAASARDQMTRELQAARLEAQAQNADLMHQFRMSQAATAEARAAETERHNIAMEDLRKQLMALQAQRPAAQEPLVPVKEPDGRIIYVPRSQAAGREVGGRHTDVNLPRQVQQLGRDFEKAGLPQMIPVVERAMQITPDQAKFITGPGNLLPDRALPQDIREARQALQKLFNITLKDRSGAAVTYQELERLKQEFGAGVLKSPEQLLAAIRDARDIVESHYTGVGASYGREVLDAYNTNLEAIGGQPFKVGGRSKKLTPGGAPSQPGATQPQQSGIPQVTDEAAYNALPSGAEYIGPDGKRRRKR